jgi:sec-independent protein translocase protein TatB
MFLGPRKLPGIARTIGKYMAEFRKTTSEFKSTWEKEVDFAIEEETIKKESEDMSTPQAARIGEIKTESAAVPLGAPEIKQIDSSAFKDLPRQIETPEPETAPEAEAAPEPPKPHGKQDWL